MEERRNRREEERGGKKGFRFGRRAKRRSKRSKTVRRIGKICGGFRADCPRDGLKRRLWQVCSFGAARGEGEAMSVAMVATSRVRHQRSEEKSRGDVISTPTRQFYRLGNCVRTVNFNQPPSTALYLSAPLSLCSLRSFVARTD